MLALLGGYEEETLITRELNVIILRLSLTDYR
jgi:hypothetical protein